MEISRLSLGRIILCSLAPIVGWDELSTGAYKQHSDVEHSRDWENYIAFVDVTNVGHMNRVCIEHIYRVLRRRLPSI